MSKSKVIGYMDKVDFDHELGDNPNGNEVFPTIDAVLRNRKCSRICGIVKVEVTLLEVVQDEVDEEENDPFNLGSNPFNLGTDPFNLPKTGGGNEENHA